MHPQLTLDVHRVRQLVVAGWTGRDVAALEKHIRELEAIGVKRPKSTPIFYRVAASLLTTDDTIEVLGDHSSGEVECVAYSFDGGTFVGLGSDHTDRKAESVGVSLSKQMCAKPVSREIWRLEDVAPHWDALLLRSYVGVNGERRLYQEGSVAAMRPLNELFRLYGERERLAAGTAMFCGTLAVHGGIAPAEKFEMELEDPVLGRRITHSYRVKTLPDQG
ncbi:MAG: DUF2848 domain-containing protein [Xanthobacteraceae bacterium]